MAERLSYLGLCQQCPFLHTSHPTDSGICDVGEGLPRLSTRQRLELLSDLCFSALPSCLAKTVTSEECLVSPVGMNRYSVDSSASAFSHRASLPTTASLYCKRQNSGDGHLGGGPATTASGPRTSPMSSRGPSAPGMRPPGSSPKRNGTSLEGNRCGNVMHALASLRYHLLHACLGPQHVVEGGNGSCLNMGTLGHQRFPQVLSWMLLFLKTAEVSLWR